LPVPSIGDNIKKAREAAGIKTQGALARKLGVPQPQLSDWENDRYGAPDTKTR
jgi:transcriptional regulator with XRE-family HTH domain